MTEDEFKAAYANMCVAFGVTQETATKAGVGCAWYITNLVGHTWDVAHDRIAAMDQAAFAEFFLTMSVTYSASVDDTNKRFAFMQSLVDQRPAGVDLPEAWKYAQSVVVALDAKGIDCANLNPIVCNTHEEAIAVMERNNNTLQ